MSTLSIKGLLQLNITPNLHKIELRCYQILLKRLIVEGTAMSV
jgi:hypothetical protein